MNACPNRTLDPTGIREGQRWENSTAQAVEQGVWTVLSTDCDGGYVLMRRHFPRGLDGEDRTVSVGALLAYWTCLDVPQ